MPLGDQIVDEEKLFLIEISQLMSKEGVVELEYYYCVTSDELTDLGIEEQWLLTSQGQPRQRFPSDGRTHYYL